MNSSDAGGHKPNNDVNKMLLNNHLEVPGSGGIGGIRTHSEESILINNHSPKKSCSQIGSGTKSDPNVNV